MAMMAETPLKFLNPTILRSIKSIEMKARLLVEGMYASRHRCPNYGYSVEFKDYREYVAGDEPRNIDWKMLARTERFYVKRFEMESNMNVVPLLDVSASMGYRTARTDRLSKIEFASYLAASLAYLTSKQQDSPGLVVFGDAVREFIPPRQGQRHLYALLACLSLLEPSGETALGDVLRTTALRLRRRSMIVLLSDCHGDETDTVEAIKLAAARGHEVVVFHLLDQDEVDFPFSAMSNFRDLETGQRILCDPLRQKREYLPRLQAFRDAIREGCLTAGADYRFVHTGMPIETVLREYLLYRRRRG